MSKTKSKEQRTRRGAATKAVFSKQTPPTTSAICERSNLSHLPSLAVAVVLGGVPFHAFLTVWGSTWVGHYTLLRLWPELVLVALAVWVVATRQTKTAWQDMSCRRLAWPIVLYVGINLLYFFGSVLWGSAGLQAASYGLLLNTRHVAWFIVVYAVTRRSPWLLRHWQSLVVWPLAAVAVFAVVQFWVLPPDFLSHFGYKKDVTIAAIQTINQDTSTIRAQSFLRGPNPLGAYLLVGIGLLAVVRLRKMWRWGIGVVALVALILSSSRSAWLGVVISVIVWYGAKRGFIRGKRAVFSALILVLLLMVSGIFALNNQGLKNVVLHVNDHSTAPQTSNEGRLAALKSGVRDVMHEPFGRGLGTAGPASMQGKAANARNSENYFLSLGQEMGWLGMALFLLVSFRVAELLRRGTTVFERMLFAIFAGLTFVNVLSYAWADVTLAYLWWGLAAIALVAGDIHHSSFTTNSLVGKVAKP